MASFIKNITKKGFTWSVRYYYTDPRTGRRERKKEGKFPTKREAEKYWSEIKHKINNNLFAAPTEMTMAEFLDYWMTHYVKAELEPNTITSHGKYVDNHLKPKLGHIKLQELKKPILIQFYTDLKQNGRLKPTKDGDRSLSDNTVRQARAVLSSALQFAVDNEFIMRHPDVKTRMGKSMKKKKKASIDYFDAEQTKRMLDALEGHDMELLVKLTLYTGMRRAEVLGLTWDKIDLEDCSIQIDTTLNIDRERKIYLGTPKTEKSERVVYFPEKLLPLIKEKMPADPEKQKDLVFTEPDGQPVNPDTVSSRFRTFLKKSGIPHMRFHGLRHTYASTMLDRGMKIQDVSPSMGHSKLSTTSDIYTHGSTQSRKNLTEVWDNF